MFSLVDRIAELTRCFDGSAPACILGAVLGEVFTGRIAVVSSFGAEAAVLLHLVASVDRRTPVIFVDTGRHFPETLKYRDELSAALGLQDVRSVGPAPGDVERLDADASRAVWDPDGCCAFRKVAPLALALAPFEAWITGRKRFQAVSRLGLPVFEIDGTRAKINPLANWSAADIASYAVEHRLPPHPLVAEGYRSIGCEACTSIVLPDEDSRAGRWRGSEKTECGIHRREC